MSDVTVSVSGPIEVPAGATRVVVGDETFDVSRALFLHVDVPDGGTVDIQWVFDPIPDLVLASDRDEPRTDGEPRHWADRRSWGGMTGRLDGPPRQR
jgi:hypothetical protein